MLLLDCLLNIYSCCQDSRCFSGIQGTFQWCDYTYIHTYIYIEGALIFYFFGPMNQPFDYDKKKIKNMAATASFVSAFFTGQLLMAVASFCKLKSPPAYNG